MRTFTNTKWYKVEIAPKFVPNESFYVRAGNDEHAWELAKKVGINDEYYVQAVYEVTDEGSYERNI